MPSLVFWIYTYSSRKKLFPPSSLNDQLFNHHSLFELLFPRINNVHASNILLCYVLWYRLYGIIMYNRMVCYYFSSSSSLFLFLRYIALDSCVGRARSLLNSRPGPTSSLSLSLSLPLFARTKIQGVRLYPIIDRLSSWLSRSDQSHSQPKIAHAYN